MPGRGLHELWRRRHPLPIGEVWLEKGALERLGQLAVRARWQRTVLAAEADTAEVLGDRIATDLCSAGRALRRVTFPRRHGLLADGTVELRGVDRTLEMREACADVGGLDLFLDSDVLIGAGLSSSAALECSVALALRDLYELPISLREWR